MTARPLPVDRGRPRLTVLPGARARRPRPVGWTVFTLAVLAAFFGLIYSRTALDRSAFQLVELERRIALQEARYQGLRLEVARLASPERVLRKAQEMGLVFPSEVRPVAAPGVVNELGSTDHRWAEVKSVLSAQP